MSTLSRPSTPGNRPPALTWQWSSSTAKVADLGLARINSPRAIAKESALTQAGGIVGTVDFMILHIPLALGAVVPVYNLPGVKGQAYVTDFRFAPLPLSLSSASTPSLPKFGNKGVGSLL